MRLIERLEKVMSDVCPRDVGRPGVGKAPVGYKFKRRFAMVLLPLSTGPNKSNTAPVWDRKTCVH